MGSCLGPTLSRAHATVATPVTQAAAAQARSPSAEPRLADVGLGGELVEEQGDREVDDAQPLGWRWQKTHPKWLKKNQKGGGVSS